MVFQRHRNVIGDNERRVELYRDKLQGKGLRKKDEKEGR